VLVIRRSRLSGTLSELTRERLRLLALRREVSQHSPLVFADIAGVAKRRMGDETLPLGFTIAFDRTERLDCNLSAVNLASAASRSQRGGSRSFMCRIWKSRSSSASIISASSCASRKASADS
jgi:hypothetical protein